MPACGVICEYNPFHLGHAHHLEQARIRSGCEHIVCVMSGSFTQRGEAAIVDKWTRARMALANGADVVFELPTLFAVRDAQRFAFGGVYLLNALGVEALSFGCEDVKALESAEIYLQEDEARIRQGLREGQSLARARGLPNMPNLVLALEYLRAIRDIGSNMRPVPVERLGAYHDPTMQRFASATAIRQALTQGEPFSLAMPEDANTMLYEAQGSWHLPTALDLPLLACLRAAPEAYLAAIADVSEGLEHRIAACAQTAVSREGLLAQLKCKRYTHARLSRVVTQALLGIDKALVTQRPMPTYARLLGFRKEAAPLLRKMQKESQLPIITRAAEYRKQNDPAFALDLRAGDLWALGCQASDERIGHRDLTQGVVIYDSVHRP